MIRLSCLLRFIGVVSLCFLTSCAYQFGSGERHLPGDYTDVAIPVFKNQTQNVGIEAYFTNALVREFARSKIARVVEKNEAPIVIEGTIERIEYRHGGTIDASTDKKVNIPNNTVLTSEYRIFVFTDLKVVRTSDHKVLWNGKVVNERNYTAPQLGLPGINSANPLYNHSARMEVISQLAVEMMNEGHDRMTENF